ncbi:MAG: aminotransferase class I/II-fold pyridoxal phosphate-dependent enzyme [Legionella sp.]|nr:aminotransferase class I/II-fold pyridoxal phosphate-dependent enzyme [Legionella sp.]
MQLEGKLKQYTDNLRQKGLIRSRMLSQASEPRVICFDSNDYLSLTNHKEVMDAYQQGYALFPSGSGGSMLLSGYHPSHKATERAFAQWLQVDDCLLFPSGFAANLAVTALLGALNAHCLIDKGVHASIYDGLKLARVPFNRFLHNNMQDAALRIAESSAPAVLVTEGIFSMSGQQASLKELAALCSQKCMPLLVDEAHSIGVLGAQGQGAVAQAGLSQTQVPLRIIPLGKAFAGQAAVVVGQEAWIHGLMQAARSLIYSTAISPAMSYGLLKTLDIVVAADDRRAKLQALIQQTKACIQASALNWIDSPTPIQQLHLGCPHLALYYAQELINQGFSCSAIRQPTVSLKASGLRIILNYHHQPEQIVALFQTLACIHDHTPH